MPVSAINRTSLGGTYPLINRMLKMMLTPRRMQRMQMTTMKATNHKTTQTAYSKSFTVFVN